MSQFKAVVASFTLAAACGAGVASAETPPPPPLRLDEVVQRALAKNPELAAARFEAAAAHAKADKDGALPNPMLSFGVMDRAEGGDWPDTEEKRVMLEQRFPAFGKRGLQRALAKREAEGAAHAVESERLSLKRQVQETFFELHAIRRSVAITRDEGKVLQDIAETARSLYAAGSRSQGDVFSAESETALLKQKLIALEARERSLEGKLNALLNRPADTPVGPLAPPPAVRVPEHLTSLFAVAAQSRPEVLYAQTLADRDAIDQRLQGKASLPDYQLGLEYRQLGMDEDMVMVTVGIDLPIRRASIRAGIRQSALLRESSLAAAEAAARASELEIQNAAIALTAAQRTLDLTRTELIPQAEARFKASEAAYRNGKAGFADYLDSQRFLLVVKVDEAMTQAEVGKQAARLEQAAGIDLFN